VNDGVTTFVTDVGVLLRLRPSKFYLCVSFVHMMCAYHVHNNILIYNSHLLSKVP